MSEFLTPANCKPVSINQSINQFISRHSIEARATVRLCRIKEKCLKTYLKCVNGWSSSTVQWKRVPKSRSSNGETTSSSVQVVRRNWQKLLCGWSQQTRLTVWADQIRWLLERSNQITKFGEFEVDALCSGVARICCEEGQSWKVGHGALTADFRAGCSSGSMTNSFVTDAVLIERAVSCWHLRKLLWQTIHYLDSWLWDLL